jgi:hypothetical protein
LVRTRISAPSVSIVPPGMSVELVRTALTTSSKVRLYSRSVASLTSIEISHGFAARTSTLEMPSSPASSSRTISATRFSDAGSVSAKTATSRTRE